VALVVLDRHVLFDLPGHISAQIQFAERSARRRQTQDHRRRKPIVCRPTPFACVEDVDAVPDALAAPTLGSRCWRGTGSCQPKTSPSRESSVHPLPCPLPPSHGLQGPHYLHFLSNTAPANPSSRFQRYTLDRPPS
jgi:hypothetical protein